MHHQVVCPWNLHEKNSPSVQPWVIRPSTLKGCVGTLPQWYVPNIPLPRVPLRQSINTSQVHTIPDYNGVPYVVPTYFTPRSIVESAAYEFSPAWHAVTINTQNNLLSNLNGNGCAFLALNNGLSSDLEENIHIASPLDIPMIFFGKTRSNNQPKRQRQLTQRACMQSVFVDKWCVELKCPFKSFSFKSEGFKI